MIEYNKTEWKAGREGGTAWTPERLNNIENGIKQATNQINTNTEAIETINSNLTYKIIASGANYTITRGGNIVIFYFAGMETKTGTDYRNYLTDLNIPKMSAFAPMINIPTGELVYVIMDTHGIITVASNRGIPINDNVNLVGQVCWNV